MSEKPSERASYTFWLFLILLSYLFVFGAVALAILGIVALMDKSFGSAAIFFAAAAACYGIKVLIFKLDDKHDKKTKLEKEQASENKTDCIVLTDDVLGTVRFAYDPEEMMITAEKEQLPAFANGEGICVRAYDDLIGYTGSPEKAALKLIEAVKRVYNDKDELMSGLCGAYLSRCESEGITETDGARVDEELIRKTMRYEKLWVGCDDGKRCNAELKAVPDPGILFDTAARAEFFTDEAGYKYGTRANW